MPPVAEPAPAEPIIFPVGGMTCAACTSSVEKALCKIPGVERASANLIARNVAVYGERIDPHVLVDAVREIGYEADLPGRNQDLVTRQKDRDRAEKIAAKQYFIRAGIALLGMLASMLLMHHVPNLWLTLGSLALSLLVGSNIYARAWAAVRNRSFDMNLLVGLGSIGSFAMSFLAPHSYAEGALGILGFVLLGNGLEAKARNRTTLALSSLAELVPSDVTIRENGNEQVVPSERVRRGDILAVKPGERIGFDGVVVEGQTTIDESLLSGESMPVSKTVNDQVYAGSLNQSAYLLVRVTAIGDEGTVGKLLRLLYEAQLEKAQSQRLADRLVARFVPLILLLSAGTFVFWMAMGMAFIHALMFAVAVLVVACPCALGLAVPTAVVVATGRAAKLGALIKGGAVLEQLARTSLVVFDKTGTLTAGKPRLVAIIPDEPHLLQLAAAIESGSEHPLAVAVTDAAKQRQLPSLSAQNIVASAGVGLVGSVTGKKVEIRRIGPSTANPDETGSELLVDDKVCATLWFRDSLRPEAPDILQRLAKRGMKVAILSGDRSSVVTKVAETLQVSAEYVAAQTTPQGKVDAIFAWQKKGNVVAMVGDGLNDAAALAKADVGIAMSTGTDISAAASAVTLFHAGLNAIPKLFSLAKAADRTMKRNIAWACLYNALCLPVAAGALSHWNIYLTPSWASALMAISSVSVVMSSLWQPAD